MTLTLERDLNLADWFLFKSLLGSFNQFVNGSIWNNLQGLFKMSLNDSI